MTVKYTFSDKQNLRKLPTDLLVHCFFCTVGTKKDKGSSLG